MTRTSEFKELKQVLDSLGLSQSWAAKQVGVTPTYLGMILAGKATPSSEVKGLLMSLRDKLRVSGLRAI